MDSNDYAQGRARGRGRQQDNNRPLRTPYDRDLGERRPHSREDRPQSRRQEVMSSSGRASPAYSRVSSSTGDNNRASTSNPSVPSSSHAVVERRPYDRSLDERSTHSREDRPQSRINVSMPSTPRAGNSGRTGLFQLLQYLGCAL
jgi:hypothetical protein